MNITLAIDDELLKKARKLAAERNTSLNKLVREYLQHLTNASEQQRLLDRLEILWEQSSLLTVDSTYQWSREDAYDRSVLR